MSDEYERQQVDEKLQKQILKQRIEHLLGILFDFKQSPENFRTALEGFFRSDRDRVAQEFSKLARYSSGDVKGNIFENLATHIGSANGVAYTGMLSNAFISANKLTADYDDFLGKVSNLFDQVNKFYDRAFLGFENVRWDLIEGIIDKIPFLKERMRDEFDLDHDIGFYYGKYQYRLEDQSDSYTYNGYGHKVRKLSEKDRQTLRQFQKHAEERFKQAVVTEKPIVLARTESIRALIPEWKHLAGSEARARADQADQIDYLYRTAPRRNCGS